MSIVQEKYDSKNEIVPLNDTIPTMISSVDVIKPVEKSTSCGNSCLKTFLTVVAVIVVILTFPFSLYYCVKMVREYERAVLFRLGRLKKKDTVGPGIFFILPCLDEVGII